MSLVNKQLLIVTVRHGETAFNKKEVMSGWTDIALSEVGIEKLKHLKETVNYPITDRYYTSGLKRAIDTFDILFGDTQELSGQFEAFNEVYFGGVEGLPIDEVAEDFYKGFLSECPYKEGETLNTFIARTMGKLSELCDELIKDNLDSLTIVSHSGTSRVIDYVLNKRPIHLYRTTRVENGLGYIFQVDYNPGIKEFTLLHQEEIE